MANQYLTLADYGKHPSDLVKAVAKTMRETSAFMDKLQFIDAGSLSVKVNREPGVVTDVGWRNIGEAHGSVKQPKPEELEEMGYSIGNVISVDKVYMKDKSTRLVDPFTWQTSLTVKAITRNLCDKVITGVPTDLKNPVGINFRVMNDLPASQRLSAGGSGLDISPDATGLAANIQTFIDYLDSLLYAVNDDYSKGGQGVLLLTNDTVIGRANSAFRQSGLLKETEDALGRTFLTYKGATFVDMSRKADDVTRILGNAELVNGTASTGGTASSIYAAKLGKEYFTGWQEYPLDVSNPELDPVGKVTYNSVIDWYLGIAVSHPRSLARLYGIIAA